MFLLNFLYSSYYLNLSFFPSVFFSVIATHCGTNTEESSRTSFRWSERQLIYWTKSCKIKCCQRYNFCCHLFFLSHCKPEFLLFRFVTKNCIAWLAWLSRRFARVHSLFILGSCVSVSKRGIFCNLSIIRLFRKF